MSTNPHDGAYPASVRKIENYMDEGGYGRTRTITAHEGGLTKRELFAALAMQGVITELADSNFRTEQVLDALRLPRDTKYSWEVHWPRFVAGRAVGYADALIAALNKESQS